MMPLPLTTLKQTTAPTLAISQGNQTTPQPFTGHLPTTGYREVEQSPLQIWQPSLSSSDLHVSSLSADDVVKVNLPKLPTLPPAQPSIAAVTEYNTTTTSDTLSINVHRRKSSPEPLHKRPKFDFNTTNTQYTGK